ncbi:MAG: GAF domain-containing protein [Ardenticatenaceae bacterium]|nr:GAF domain-containing protein [Ardenticatenaceae bacterium]
MKLSGAAWLLVALAVARILVVMPPHLQDLPIAFLFAGLLIASDTFSIPAGGGYISMLPTLVMTAFLVLGLPYASLLVFVTSVVHALVRWLGSERLELPRVANKQELMILVAANGTMLTTTILVSGTIFEQWFDVPLPLQVIDNQAIIPLTVFVLAYMAVNHLIAAFFFWLRGGDRLAQYRANFLSALLYETTAMPFAPLIALIYTRIGPGYFVMFALALVMASLVMHNLALVKRGLERRVRELSGLQAIGQVLSASLDLDEVLTAVYQHVSGLMPTTVFFVALYDETKNEVSFPLAVQENKPLNWSPRPLANGLTDYIIRSRQPLLIRKNMPDMLANLQLDLIGKISQSWLGVPILAGDQLLGVLSVQSVTELELFDEGHQELLLTIAAQAAVAIQNARLYTQTDKALTRRVQEMDSILTTAEEGMMLLDNQLEILTVNRAFRAMFKLDEAAVQGQRLTAVSPDTHTLLAQIGYSLAELEADCAVLLSQQTRHMQKQITLAASAERHFERQLSPVYGAHQTVTGWLLVLRDITEEVELEQLRQEMTHMLVHDLRSPLSVMKGSIEVLKSEVAELDRPLVESLVEYMEVSSERILKLVGDLLDIHQFESGSVPLQKAHYPVDVLFAEVVAQFEPMLKEMNLTITVEVAEVMPMVCVDGNYMGRVLTNLVDNAIKYTEDNGRIRLWAHMADGRGLQLGVEDTGIGIPPEVQSKMFLKFHKDLSGKGRRKGSGLGLSFCKLVVEAHGGQIWVESSGVPGEGSCFIIRLPICTATVL